MKKFENKKVTYICFFQFSDTNPASQRVLRNSTLFNKIGINTSFITVSLGNNNQKFVKNSTNIEVKSPFILLLHRFGFFFFRYLKILKNEKSEAIILYNFPSILIFLFNTFKKIYKYKVILDITEWYETPNILKKIDVFLRMRFLSFFVDGLIVISNFLYKYFELHKYKGKLLILPPLSIKSQIELKKINYSRLQKRVKFIYAGNPSKIKDNINIFLNAVYNSINRSYFSTLIFGITKKDYVKLHPYQKHIIDKINVRFYGKVSKPAIYKNFKKVDFQIIIRKNIRVNNAGFPTKLIDSFECGVPVISTYFSDISSYLVDNYNSYLIEFNTAEITKLLNNIANFSSSKINYLTLNLQKNNPFLIDNFFNQTKRFFDFLLFD